MKRKVIKSKPIDNWLNNWRREVNTYHKSIIFSIFLLVLAGVINYNAGIYVSEKGSAAVTDFILDNVGPYDLSYLFIYVWLFLVGVFIIYPMIFRVNIVHKVLAQFSFLIIIRSFFVVLTHLKDPITAIYESFPSVLNFLVFRNDLFFSGHTAVPFLGFLVYEGLKMRWLFLAGSILMAATVLLMHQHYSIDVFSAYFITYGSYHLAKFFSPFNFK